MKAVALDANFVEIDEPVFGAIMLLGIHHVALVYARDGGAFVCLGGNQSDQINFSPFSKNMRFFVPLAYHPFAKQEVARGIGLPKHTADELNTAFGIKLKKKGNATDESILETTHPYWAWNRHPAGDTSVPCRSGYRQTSCDGR